MILRIRFKCNQQILFEEGAEIRLKPSDKRAYVMLNLTDVSGVALINLVVKGDREGHTGKGGEHGMGTGYMGQKAF